MNLFLKWCLEERASCRREVELLLAENESLLDMDHDDDQRTEVAQVELDLVLDRLEAVKKLISHFSRS